MPNIKLPDGSVKKYNQVVSIADVAKDIGEGLARAALAGKIQDQLVDLSYEIAEDTSLSIITSKSPESLDVIRHSTAHLLAQAVKTIFPDVQVTIGPVIEDGFYYDFSYKRPFTPEDLAQIEKKMSELAKQNLEINRKVMQRQAAIDYFESIGEKYKSEIISSIPEGEEVSLYEQGDFTDLCRGPHVPSTGKLKVFKLMKLAGAYWRGDSKNEMLQRIYGTAWNNKDELKDYLKRLEEAEKRDHRKLGKLLDLFHMQDTSPGMVFWHAKGWSIWLEIENYLRQKSLDYGYDEIKTPTVLDKELWKSSGHWDNYHENMFTTASENREYAVKPMNCPGHVQIFNNSLHSYRDLPLRLAEFGSCHRNEPSGALHGLLRVRGFTQDDAHIFCTEEQIKSEVKDFSKMLYEVYSAFGFDNVLVMLSTRPEKRVGTDDIWEKAELALEDALKETRIEYTLQEGEGAFYGPKLDFYLHDAIGRVWQCGTLQVDFVLPERLDANYISQDGSKCRPVMLHRAVLGSMERWIGILIEQYSGRFPMWLAPIQGVVTTITGDADTYANIVFEKCKKAGLRIGKDLRNEKINYKIREHSQAKIPAILVVGEREEDQGTVAIRRLGGKTQEILALDEAINKLVQESTPPE